MVTGVAALCPGCGIAYKTCTPGDLCPRCEAEESRRKHARGECGPLCYECMVGRVSKGDKPHE